MALVMQGKRTRRQIAKCSKGRLLKLKTGKIFTVLEWLLILTREKLLYRL